MARKDRKQRYRKRSVEISSKEETIAKLDSLAVKAKIQKKQEIFGTKSKNKTYVAIIAVVIILGGFTGYFTLFNNNNSNTFPSGNGNPINEVNYLVCEHDNSGDHYHFTLEVYINGIINDLPIDIGRTSCVRPIHSHSELNRIHVELPSSFTIRPKLNDVFIVYQDSYPNATLSLNELMSVKGNVTATTNNVDLTDFISYEPSNLEVIRLYVNS